ncbi:electron transfer flavoprotein subunit alpha/FixB family protein [Clostridium transplantifaecale]|uniref:electron transfer flavoprotein subunit alpha/FixB family protein n=1 Tax=Clostridium transplantifaecale TaxID=2479838 RepID=UPI000F63295E|nr:electron transfer flavoprotein subunit alpha/FixB family protein [Clostridium transplantifaecale]
METEAKTGGIWIYAQTQGEKLHPVVYELLGVGRRLADELSCPLGAMLADCREALVEELFEYGADEVCIFEHSLLSQYSTDGYTKAVEQLVRERQPFALLIGGTDQGRDLAPRAAARIKTGLTVDCIEFKIEGKHTLCQIRPAFGSRLMAEIVTVGNTVSMCTVRPGMFAPAVSVAGRRGKLWHCSLELLPSEIRTRVVESEPEEYEHRDLACARVVVAGGMGVGGREGFELLDKLSKHLGGVTGGTRPAAANGWISHEKMIGQTGRIIAPELYIACGISGAVQHMLGVGGAKCVVAINSNPDAPIFETADYGIVADYRQFIPKLIEELE